MTALGTWKLEEEKVKRVEKADSKVGVNSKKKEFFRTNENNKADFLVRFC